MALNKWGFVYTLGGDSEAARRDEIGSDACRLVAVGVPDVSHAARVAIDLANDGCELVEFCGAFGAGPMAEVIAALEPLGVPVGTVSYGGDATSGLHQIFG
ncbi:MAG: hypothetical protein DHS20C19_21090 [Acidimicrobiales bacterium]|nr:MAG: hypothetical protein DHS20C19_21090 [Acidimicrobiales bacterium]